MAVVVRIGSLQEHTDVVCYPIDPLFPRSTLLLKSPFGILVSWDVDREESDNRALPGMFASLKVLGHVEVVFDRVRQDSMDIHDYEETDPGDDVHNIYSEESIQTEQVDCILDSCDVGSAIYILCISPIGGQEECRLVCRIFPYVRGSDRYIWSLEVSHTEIFQSEDIGLLVVVLRSYRPSPAHVEGMPWQNAQTDTLEGTDHLVCSVVREDGEASNSLRRDPERLMQLSRARKVPVDLSLAEAEL